MLRAGEELGWVDDAEEDDYDASLVSAVALKYYGQWCAGQLDPNEPVHVELLLAAEHLINETQRRIVGVLAVQPIVKLTPLGMMAAASVEAGSVLEAGIASNADEPELS